LEEMRGAPPGLGIAPPRQVHIPGSETQGKCGACKAQRPRAGTGRGEGVGAGGRSRLRVHGTTHLRQVIRERLPEIDDVDREYLRAGGRAGGGGRVRGESKAQTREQRRLSTLVKMRLMVAWG
jgi:hypothetical protein